ncbi:MAG TPA: TetR/AcrR family transcriptional regulator [Gemmataceae bacterium]
MRRTRNGRGRRPDPGLAARRREEILDAAAPLFARSGYPDADLQELADRLGLAKGTLYLYFPSKEALFLAAVDRGMRRLRAHVEAACAGIADPLQRLTAAIRAYLEFFREHPDQAELLIIERAEFRDRKCPTYLEHREAHRDEWREVFAGLIRCGRVRDIPPDRILDVIGDLLYGTMFTNHFRCRHSPLDAQVRDVTDILFHGILAPGRAGREVCPGENSDASGQSVS